MQVTSITTSTSTTTAPAGQWSEIRTPIHQALVPGDMINCSQVSKAQSTKFTPRIWSTVNLTSQRLITDLLPHIIAKNRQHDSPGLLETSRGLIPRNSSWQRPASGLKGQAASKNEAKGIKGSGAPMADEDDGKDKMDSIPGNEFNSIIAFESEAGPPNPFVGSVAKHLLNFE
ncbi:hypothetical protein BX616_000864, partial [Lobosporangium transversale]